MGGLVLGILVWQEGGEAVGLLLVIGAVSLAAFAYWLVRRKRDGQADADRSRSLQIHAVQVRDLRAVAPEHRPRWRDDHHPDLPADGPRVQRPAGGPVPRAAFAEHVRDGHHRRPAEREPPAGQHHPGGFRSPVARLAPVDPDRPRADAGWYLAIPLAIAGIGLGLLVSQLNNYTLSPIVEERVSEAAGVNSAAGSFGLSFGLAFAGAIMLATLAFSFTNLAEASAVLGPEQQQEVAAALEHDAEVMTNTALDALIVRSAAGGRGRDHPHQHRGPAVALQVALLIPIFASLLGLLTSFRMMRQPDPVSSGDRRDGPGVSQPRE